QHLTWPPACGVHARSTRTPTRKGRVGGVEVNGPMALRPAVPAAQTLQGVFVTGVRDAACAVLPVHAADRGVVVQRRPFDVVEHVEVFLAGVDGVATHAAPGEGIEVALVGPDGDGVGEPIDAAADTV